MNFSSSSALDFLWEPYHCLDDYLLYIMSIITRFKDNSCLFEKKKHYGKLSMLILIFECVVCSRLPFFYNAEIVSATVDFFATRCIGTGTVPCNIHYQAKYVKKFHTLCIITNFWLFQSAFWSSFNIFAGWILYWQFHTSYKHIFIDVDKAYFHKNETGVLILSLLLLFFRAHKLFLSHFCLKVTDLDPLGISIIPLRHHWTGQT